jgi:hypothetical protein
MDLKLYYQKIRDVAAQIEEPFPVMVSRETADGGKDGVLTEVSQALAAKMVVEGTARVATVAEAKDFRQKHAEERRILEQAAAAAKVQLAVLSTDELHKLKGTSRSKD